MARRAVACAPVRSLEFVVVAHPAPSNSAMNHDTASPPPLTTRGCVVNCALRDGIVEVAITGLLISAEALRLHRTLLQCLRAEAGIRGVVVDLRHAVVLIDDDVDPLGSGDHAKPTWSQLPKRPVAVVVTPEVESRFLPWAWEMAAAGLVRAAFVDRDEALAWVGSRGRQPA